MTYTAEPMADAPTSRTIALVVAGLLAACGGGGGGPMGPTGPVGTVTGQTGTFAGIQVTLLQVESPWDPPPDAVVEPDPGFAFATAEIRYVNGSAQSRMYDTFEFELRAAGQAWGPDPGWRAPDLDGGTLQPGGSATGWITVQIPAGSTPTHLLWTPQNGVTLSIPVP